MVLQNIIGVSCNSGFRMQYCSGILLRDCFMYCIRGKRKHSCKNCTKRLLGPLRFCTKGNPIPFCRTQENIGMPQSTINLIYPRNSLQQLTKGWVVSYPLDDFARRIYELWLFMFRNNATLSFYSIRPARPYLF